MPSKTRLTVQNQAKVRVSSNGRHIFYKFLSLAIMAQSNQIINTNLRAGHILSIYINALCLLDNSDYIMYNKAQMILKYSLSHGFLKVLLNFACHKEGK